MFSNKNKFIEELNNRSIRTYGHEIKKVSLEYTYLLIADMVKEYAISNWNVTHQLQNEAQGKTVFYFSIEFLMGRLFTNNLMNLGVYNICKEGLLDIGIDINEIEDVESDVGLGNGGLGRLAACFLDSIASLNYQGNGNTIRYKYGFFKQAIVNDCQVEQPDTWLSLGNPWEVKKLANSVDVKFYGNIEYTIDENNHFRFEHKNAECVKAVPYDMSIVGKDTKNTNILRMWDAEVSENIPPTTNYIKYLADVNAICQNLYPDDSTDEGKILRIKQEYFFVSAGIRTICNYHLRQYDSLDNLHEKIVIQLNDTHPVLAIPELMRVLMDDYKYTWNDAYTITTNCMAYTNHTILQEALEKWPIRLFQPLLPRIYMIIQEIDRRYYDLAVSYFHDDINKVFKTLILRDELVHMGNLAVIGSYSINGVAKIHSDLVKNVLFKEFSELWPHKFSNKTNGITHRRWLLFSNPELCSLLDEKIGKGYRNDISELNKLMDFINDKDTIDKFMVVKKQRKEILAKLIYESTGYTVDINSIFDTQSKRLHAYKRQILNVLHIIYLYKKIKENPNFKMHPQTFIFAAKAAPSYHLAKKIIKLINNMSRVINNDPKVNKYLKVIFIPNYSVSIAEKLMNATDVSEQISTAGKEASGTGNMKFMMNGAITLGTMDGANIEIVKEVGEENAVIFGLNEKEVKEVKNHYRSITLYNNSTRLKKVVDSLIDGTFTPDLDEYRIIYEDLIFKNDEYLVLKDFDSYVLAQEEIQRRYQKHEAFAKTCLINIAKSGFFSSDRTIEEYVNDIWKIKKVM